MGGIWFDMLWLMVFALVYGTFVLLASSKWIDYIFDHFDYDSTRTQLILFWGIIIIMFIPVIIAGLVGEIS